MCGSLLSLWWECLWRLVMTVLVWLTDSARGDVLRLFIWRHCLAAAFWGLIISRAAKQTCGNFFWWMPYWIQAAPKKLSYSSQQCLAQGAWDFLRYLIFALSSLVCMLRVVDGELCEGRLECKGEGIHGNILGRNPGSLICDMLWLGWHKEGF